MKVKTLIAATTAIVALVSLVGCDKSVPTPRNVQVKKEIDPAEQERLQKEREEAQFNARQLAREKEELKMVLLENERQSWEEYKQDNLRRPMEGKNLWGRDMTPEGKKLYQAELDKLNATLAQRRKEFLKTAESIFKEFKIVPRKEDSSNGIAFWIYDREKRRDPSTMATIKAEDLLGKWQVSERLLTRVKEMQTLITGKSEEEALALLDKNGLSYAGSTSDVDRQVIGTLRWRAILKKEKPIWDALSKEMDENKPFSEVYPVYEEKLKDGKTKKWLERVETVHFSPDGKLFAAGSYRGLSIYETATKKLLTRIDGDAKTFSFSGDGKSVVCVGGLSAEPHVYSLDGKLLYSLPKMDHWVQGILAVGDYLAMGGTFDAAVYKGKQKVVHVKLQGNGNYPLHMETDDKGVVSLLTVGATLAETNGKGESKLLEKNGAYTTGYSAKLNRFVRWSPKKEESRKLNHFQVVERKDGKESVISTFSAVGYMPGFSPDGRLLVLSSWDGLVEVVSADTGKSVLKARFGHGISASYGMETGDWPTSAEFSPDGKQIVVGGACGVKFWKIPASK